MDCGPWVMTASCVSARDRICVQLFVAYWPVGSRLPAVTVVFSSEAGLDSLVTVAQSR